MSNFKRVSLETKLRANSDGMPVIRDCFEHETLMSFFDDDGNYAFNEWWGSEGSALFNEWVKNNDEYSHLTRE
jgi:hypothetical protein